MTGAGLQANSQIKGVPVWHLERSPSLPGSSDWRTNASTVPEEAGAGMRILADLLLRFMAISVSAPLL